METLREDLKYAHDSISLKVSYNENCFGRNLYRQNTTHISCSTTFSQIRAIYGIMRKNMVQPGRPQMAIPYNAVHANCVLGN
jgi:hypothetical protein